MTDWQKGDLALCVSRIQRRPVLGVRARQDDPTPGQMLTVSRVGTDERWGTWIAFTDYEPHRFRQFRFRKINPPKADEYDREIIDLMAGKKVPA